ncbi:hypothetical protein, partial [Klebsiella pneumoniae]|uniref:hypothetical protein n=1 Tax=Klebsiella pneumoniae TaxID=573 RepID=UPI001C52B2DA
SPACATAPMARQASGAGSSLAAAVRVRRAILVEASGRRGDPMATGSSKPICRSAQRTAVPLLHGRKTIPREYFDPLYSRHEN